MEVKPNMELRTRVSSRWLGPTGLSVQFALGHMAAALVGIVLAGSGQITLGLLAAAMTGLALTTGVQRTIWLLGSALTALKAGRSPDELSTRWHGPLAALVVNLNALIAREREIHELRSGLMQQAGEAAAQQERNRLARELHDSIKQQIFGINMSAAAAQARWESDPRCARAALEDVRRSGQEAMVEMNALLQQLSPVPLEKVGLRQALLDQCEALGYRTGAAVTAEFGELPDEDRLPPGAQKDLFRIAQEGLSNVARHARANNVHLYLGLDEAKSLLVLGIEDDGRGFNTDASHEGMGLPNIRERVQALGGLQSLDSRAGRGTTLSVHVPLLEPVLPEQVLPAYRLDHTMSRVVLVGLAGGMVLIAAMVYPLYVVLPGCLVEGWPRGSATVAFVLGLAAPLLAAATGFLAARWSRVNTRQASTLLGALAGGVAALLLYFGLAAPTAGVVGNAPLLVHGPVPASSDQEVVRLLSEAAIGLLWGVYGAFWIVLLGGVGLGAIGGLLAPLASTGPNRPTLRLSFIATLPPAIVTSTLCLLAALLVFPQPELSIRSAVVEAGGATIAVWSLAGVSLWPTCTSAALYLASLAALWFLLRTEITLGDVARLCTAYAQAGSVCARLDFAHGPRSISVRSRAASGCHRDYCLQFALG
jgi:signal transduction histidine kinase